MEGKDGTVVRKAPLPWLAAGVLLGLVQIVAVAAKKPLGVSTQFVVANTQVLNRIAPDYTATHPLISTDKYQKPGYGWWLDVGLVIGAAVAAIALRQWKVRTTTAWWRASRGNGFGGRMITGFVAGFLILLGARLAHGCTSGQFASGWAQLSVSVLPFTVGLFGVGMLVARLAHPKAPEIER
jgi:hypothetical protein